MTAYLEKWQAAANDFISVLLVRPRAWESAIEHGIRQDDLPPGAWREVYHAIIDIRGDRLQKPGPDVLTDVEVAVHCGAAITVEWVSIRIAAFDEFLNSGFEKTCEILRTYGRGTRQLSAMQRGQTLIVSALNDGTDTDNAAHEVFEDLRASHKQVAAPVEIGELVEIAERKFDEPPDAGIRTGIRLLDRWLLGLTPGEFLAWVAAQKMRKTSVLANVFLNMARDGRSMTFFSYDEARDRVVYRMIALVMAEYMWNNGHWNLRAEDGTLLNAVSGKMVRTAGNRWRQWPEPLRLAREYAYDELSTLKDKLRIYDQRTGARDLKSIRALMQRDALKYGALDMVAVDHIQRIPGLETTYERAEFGSDALHTFGGEMGAVMWVLSQMSEEGIRNMYKGEWSPRAKGGGGIASNADTVMTSIYKHGTVTDQTLLRLELKQARDAEFPVYGYVEIHPASGWITPRVVDTKAIVNAAIDNDGYTGGAL